MKALIFLVAAINLSMTMQQAEAESAYCDWLGNAAIIIAENRNNSMSEFDLTENYLDQNQSYAEQEAIIPLIKRVYVFEQDVGPREIAIVERQQCEIA